MFVKNCHNLCHKIIKPYVITHSNRNKNKDLAEDLQSKGIKGIDEMLKRISKSDGYEWKVISLVYYGPMNETEKEKIGLKRFVDEDPGIELTGYQNIPGSENETFGFFGHYIEPNTATAMGKIQPHWRFIFKAYSTGTIVGELRVSANLDCIHYVSYREGGRGGGGAEDFRGDSQIFRAKKWGI